MTRDSRRGDRKKFSGINSYITEKELENAIARLKTNKAPGTGTKYGTKHTVT